MSILITNMSEHDICRLVLTVPRFSSSYSYGTDFKYKSSQESNEVAFVIVPLKPLKDGKLLMSILGPAP